MLKFVLENEAQGDPLDDLNTKRIPTAAFHNNIPIQIEHGKTLNINVDLNDLQHERLIQIIKKYKQDFSWEYSDMKGIEPQLCTHHIYIEKYANSIHQPQTRLNPHLRDIVKQEIQKLLDVNFIYPIFGSQWASPLVVVPQNNGKWRICVDCRELNKFTQKGHFPLPFLDQVDTLARKKYFSFLDGFSGYNQIKISPKGQDKTTLTFYGELFHIESYHLGCAIHKPLLKGKFLVFFLT